MTYTRQITCIDKGDVSILHKRVKNVGGTGWKITQEDAIKGIIDGLFEFYIDADGNKLEVTLGKTGLLSHYYLKTTDDASSDPLLSLSECEE